MEQVGDTAYMNMEKINSELFTMTYGALVMHLMEVNKRLDSMGYNMGTRITDELLAKAKISHCQNFGHTAEIIAKVAFKMYLGVEAEIRSWSEDRKTFVLRLQGNPLSDFVEIPDGFESLVFCNLYCGVLRGALEMVNLRVKCEYVSDSLQQPEIEYDEIKIKLEEVLDPIFRDDD